MRTTTATHETGAAVAADDYHDDGGMMRRPRRTQTRRRIQIRPRYHRPSVAAVAVVMDSDADDVVDLDDDVVVDGPLVTNVERLRRHR